MISQYDALTTLYEHASDHMSAAELREVGQTLTNEAVTLARRLDTVFQHIACLVLEDSTHSPSVGSFQEGGSAFDLLSAVAQQFDALAGMVEVGDEAKRKASEIERKSP